MARIDCSVTVNFLREFKRMCDGHEHCSQCAFNEPARSKEISCNMYCKEHPEIAVENVQAWSDKHPPKTRLEDLLEKYPKLPLRDDGLLDFLPSCLGYCEDCRNCRCFENISSDVCWNEPVDGGATGKAVE